MKLKSNLNQISSILYIAPLIDVLLLLLIFFLFNSNLVLKLGVNIDLPNLKSYIPTTNKSHIITLTPVESKVSKIYFNDNLIELNKLELTLDNFKNKSNKIILLGDENISYGEIMKISQIILEKGFELSFATE